MARAVKRVNPEAEEEEVKKPAPKPKKETVKKETKKETKKEVEKETASKVSKKKEEDILLNEIVTSKLDIKVDDKYLSLTLKELRKLYAKTYIEKERLKQGAYCHKCGKFLAKSAFYINNSNASGCSETCKACVFKVATNYNERTKETNETIDSLKEALKLCDRPFLRSVYEASVKAINNDTSENLRKYVFKQYITLVSSLGQYSNLKWADSDEEFLEDSTFKEASRKTRKFFGEGFSNEDYAFLQDQYDDWVSRHSVDTKSMEEVVKRLCFKQLEILKATRSGNSTKDLDATFQNLLDTANLKPKQNSLDSLSNAQTIGTLIDKWENEKPLPEIDERLKDVDNIGLYIDVFFKGHLAKMLGIRNPLSEMYDNYMKDYTVRKPEYSEEEDSEALFEKIFGNLGDSE